MTGSIFKKVEQKWQTLWDEKKSFKFDESKGQSYYVLSMFPYPSGALHVGHVRNYVLGDVVARFKKAQQYNVLHPMGWDAFGLPAENAALLNNSDPAVWTRANIENMRKQLKGLGLSYDWDREFATCEPSYYKHEQEMFISFWEKGLLLRKEALVNWDPVDQTILANEQVENGRGWRSGALVEKRSMCQWFVQQSQFAQDLLDDIDALDGWPLPVRTMQRNWIGQSEGAEIIFEIQGQNPLKVYSTRPETLYGCTFCAVSFEHDLTANVMQQDEKIAQQIKSGAEFDEQNQNTMFGVKLPYMAINPISGEEVPVFAVNYVLQEYGTGAVFGCPAHDERDFRFATQMNLPIKSVISSNKEGGEGLPQVVPLDCEAATMKNSADLDGLTCSAAKKEIIQRLEAQNKGVKKIQFRLRDWCVSRQRYWGTPVPMTHCQECGVQPVARETLPVELPANPQFGSGNPLDHDDSWKQTTCSKCGGAAVRDTDTLDTFFESCWYFLRFASQPKDKAFDPSVIEKVLPVDFYIGGVEHAVLHLLYARLFMLLLKKCGYLKSSVPFANLLTQGMVCYRTYRTRSGEWVYPSDVCTVNGVLQTQSGEEVIEGPSEKMSKSKKNTVNIDEIVTAYGADALRIFIVADVPPERHFDWSDDGLQGSWRFIKKVYSFLDQYKNNMLEGDVTQAEQTFLVFVNKIIYQVTEALESQRINVAVAQVRILYNGVQDMARSQKWHNARFGWETFCRLADPFVPHLCAEMRSLTGMEEDNTWPTYDESLLVSEEVTVAVQINGRVRGTVDVAKGASQEVVEQAAKEIVTKHIGDKSPKRVIFVADKILSVIV